MLTGDVGRLAAGSRGTTALAEAALALFHPLKFMLASPAEDAAEIVARLGPEVWVEDKYDGIRAQLHRRGDEVRLYSRDLHDISGQFPEIVDGGRGRSPGTASSTARSWPGGTAPSCRSSRSRRGSAARSPSAAIQAEVPVIYVAFDVLAAGPARTVRPVEPLLRPAAPRAARPARGARPAAGQRRRTVRPLAPRRRRRDADALERPSPTRGPGATRG